MKDKLNVWYWNKKPKYYLIHPWEWFKELGQNIKNVYDRATKGYCCLDWYDFDTWFIYVASDMLRELAMRSHGYPGTEPFDTPEKWRSWLHRMADQLITSKDEDYGNEYYKPYLDSISKNLSLDISEETEEEKELRKKYYNRSIEVQKEHKKLFESTMSELIKYWDNLWD